MRTGWPCIFWLSWFFPCSYNPGCWWLLCCQCSCGPMLSFAASGPPGPLPQNCPQVETAQPVLLQGLVLPRWGTLHLSLLNFLRFLLDHSSCLPRSIWILALPFTSAYSLVPLFCVIFKFYKSALCHILQVTDENVKQIAGLTPVVFYLLPALRWRTTH